jgi:hypothetical protein
MMSCAHSKPETLPQIAPGRVGRVSMTCWKIACGAGFVLVLASNIWSISGWTEARGVYDDVCYLRQAHLFQRFGLAGLDTDISRDDDHYLSSKLKEIGFSAWNIPASAPCHTFMETSKKWVIQYPPGTGFLLSLFPSGFQVIPLYVLASVVALRLQPSGMRRAFLLWCSRLRSGMQQSTS